MTLSKNSKQQYFTTEPSIKRIPKYSDSIQIYIFVKKQKTNCLDGFVSINNYNNADSEPLICQF